MPDPEREHGCRSGDGVSGTSRGDDERVEPAARQQRGEQPGQGRPSDGRFVARRQQHRAEPPLQPRRRERAGNARAERCADRRERPRDHQGTRKHRRATPDSREASEVVDAGADRACAHAKRHVRDEAPAVVREMGREIVESSRGPRSGVRADESAAHRRAVDASHQAGEEHSGEQGHEPAAGTASTRDVAVKCSDPRLTSNRSSHSPP